MVTTFYWVHVPFNIFKFFFMIIIATEKKTILNIFESIQLNSFINLFLVDFHLHPRMLPSTRAFISFIFCQIWDLFNQRKIRVLNAKKNQKRNLSLSHSLAYIIFIFFSVNDDNKCLSLCIIIIFYISSSNESSFRRHTVNLEFGDYKWESILRHLFMCTVHYVF